jgi:hypothetical protein
MRTPSVSLSCGQDVPRLIAEQILKDLVELSKSKGLARRLAFDGPMLTAHQRIARVAARQLDGQSKTG